MFISNFVNEKFQYLYSNYMLIKWVLALNDYSSTIILVQFALCLAYKIWKN